MPSYPCEAMQAVQRDPSWDGRVPPEHPRNWGHQRKYSGAAHGIHTNLLFIRPPELTPSCPCQAVQVVRRDSSWNRCAPPEHPCDWGHHREYSGHNSQHSY